jgi:PAS domain S-box-containing protein
MTATLQHLWRRLTAPLVSTPELEKARYIELLAGMTLIVVIVCYLATFAAIPLLEGQTRPWLPLALLASSVFWLPYFLFRRGKLAAASVVFTVWAYLEVILMAAVLGGERGLSQLYYAVLASAFAVFTFRTVRAAGLLAISNLLMIGLASLLLQVDTHAVMAGPVNFNIVCAVLLLAFGHFWRQREAERRRDLKSSEERYRAISEMASDFTVYCDVDAEGRAHTRWIIGPHEAITGYAVDEVAGTDGGALCHPDDRARMIADRARIVHGEGVTGEYRLIHKNGSILWARISRRPVWDERHSRVIGFYAVLNDITDHKLAEEQRLRLTLQREQLNVVKDFVHAISHDFRNRLSIIENNRYLIGRTVDAPNREKIEPRLETISTAMQDITTQIEHLVDMADIAVPQPSPLDLNRLLQEIAEQKRRQAAARRIDLKVTLDESVPPVLADWGQLRLALDHLVSNAITYSREGGEVQLQAQGSSSGRVEVLIADSGVGIPPEQLATIFAPFAKIGSARTISQGGLGVGLTIAKLVMDAHQGEISVESEVGRGSTFRLALPLATSTTQALIP